MYVSSSARPINPSYGKFRRSLQRHPLVYYFLMAYAFSWLGWLPYILSLDGLGLLPVHLTQLGTLPGAYLGPLLSGFLMTGVTEGKAGLRRLLRRFVLWRVGWQWYPLILLGVPAILFLGFLTQSGSRAALHNPFPQFVLFFPLLLILEIVTSGLAEEPGWRGFALPRLQSRYGPLVGTLMLGLLWGGWHLPLFLTAWGGGASGPGICEFILGIVSTAIIITWVFNHTRGSLLMTILLHATVDTFGSAAAATGLFSLSWMQQIENLALLIGFGVVALLLIVVTRGRLGYRQEPSPSGTTVTLDRDKI